MGKRMLLAVLLLSLLAGLTAGTAQAQGQSPQETWVLQQVAAGLTADLQEKFGSEEKARVLRGRFLEALLTDALPGIKVHSRGISIKNAVIPDYVDLRSGEVRHAVELNACVFPHGCNFNYSHFKKSLSLDQSRIGGWASFSGLKVDSDFSLNEASFQGGMYAEGTNIVGKLSARGVRFTHKDLGANFSNLQVGSDADFPNAQFQGNIFFSRVAVKGNFSIFNASFSGTAFFDGARISGDLNTINAKFAQSQEPVYLTNVQVGGHAYLSNMTAPGGVSMAMGHFLDVFLGSTSGPPLAYQQVVLDYAVVDRLLDLRNLELGKLAAKKFLGKDLVWLDNVRIKDEAQLQSGSFQTLLLIKVAWPTKNTIWLDEMTYQAISARDQAAEESPQDWLKLLNLLQISRFNTQNYSQLESYFQRRGEKDKADEVFIQGKRREVLEKWWRPTNLATFVFWDLLAGYGRKPSRTLWISLAIVMLGMLFFDHRNFDPSFVGGWKWLLNGDPSKTTAIRFFLSLDEFLPGVDLGLAKLWQLSQISFGTLLYYHFHKIAGWILIPIALAAVYTQFK